jgi:hypothetical protein
VLVVEQLTAERRPRGSFLAVITRSSGCRGAK